MKERYWAFLTEKHFQLTLLKKVNKKKVNSNNWLSLIELLLGSSAIFSVFLDKSYLLASSAIIIVIISFYKKVWNINEEITQIKILINDLQIIYSEIEKSWFEIIFYNQNNKLLDIVYDYEKRWQHRISLIYNGEEFYASKSTILIADQESNKYLDNHLDLEEGE